MVQKIKRYGWRRDLPDARDLFYKAPPALLKALPPRIDLREQMPVVVDQGNLGSCTANATSGQIWHLELQQGHKPLIEPARLFIYYNSRVLEGTVKEDSGATIRDSIKSVVKWGFAAEEVWPYDIAKFTRKPPKKVYNSALKERIAKYARVAQTAAQIKARLAENHTVNFGFSVYESFETDEVFETGIVVMPGNDEALLGGHAVLIVGYDDEKEWYIVRNSWGLDWGDEGYFYMPYDYVHDPLLASDFWTITAVP
jgi:C1A family cysteine protease